MSLSLRRGLRHRLAAVFVGAALTAGLAACGQSPSVAATVGGHDITIDELSSETQKSFDDPAVGEALDAYGEEAVRKVVLDQLVQVEIAEQIAKAEGIEIDEDQALDDLLGGATIEEAQMQQPLTETMLRRQAVIQYVITALGEKATGKPAEAIQADIEAQIKASYASDPSLAKDWQLSILEPQTEEEADLWVSQINSGELTMEQIGAGLPPSGQTGAPQPTQLPYNTRGEGGADPILIALLDATGVGEVGKYVVPGQIDPANPSAPPVNQALVIRVDSVTVAGDAEIAAQAQQQAQQEFSQAGQTAAANAAKKIEITINPRFGTLERPELGLPTVGDPEPDTFTKPTTSAPGGGLPPGLGGG